MCSTPLISWAQSAMVFDADFMERDAANRQILLKGNVQVIYNTQVLNCDSALILLDTNEVVVDGGFVLVGPDIYIEGERARLNLESKTGTIHNGFVRSGQVTFEGDVIHRLGELDYEADRAFYSACLTCPPGWSFSGKNIRAELGGYARISQPLFRIGNIPILWLPYLIVPLKTERQTGFLVPDYGFSSTSGQMFGMSFFWAMGRSHDSTWVARYHEKRGIFNSINYRYVLSNNSRGELKFGTIQDRFFKNEARLGPRQGELLRRWSLGYEHFFDFGDGLTQSARINSASDLLYPRDFPDEIEGYNDPALESRLAMTRNTERNHISVQGNLYTTLIKEDILASNDDAIHRFPQVRYSLAERRLLDSPLLYSFDLDYVNFVRNSLSYDEIISRDPNCAPDCLRTERDSSRYFDPSQDMIRTGERLDLKPQLAYLVPLGSYFDLTPWAQYRFTQYLFPVTGPEGGDFNSSPQRSYAETGASLRTRISRIFGASEDPKASRYKHELQFNLDGSTIPYFKRTDHPFFGDLDGPQALRELESITDNDFFSGRNFQFDSYDQVQDRQVVTLTLDNFLTERFSIRDTYAYRQVVYFRLSQSYDFTEAKKEDGLPWSPIRGILDLRFRRFNANISALYFPYLNKVNSSSRLRLRDDRGNFVQVGFTQSYRIPANPSDFDYDSRQENLGIGVGAASRYVDISTSLDYDTRTSEINSWSLHSIFIPPGDCWRIHSQIRQLSGSSETIFQFDFQFDFGGNT